MVFTDELQPEYYENLNIHDIVTPIKLKILGSLLQEAGYDVQKTEELVQSFTTGFDIGYRGKISRQDTSKNLILRVGLQTELWNKIMKEVSLGRYAGPFTEIPFQNYMQLPVGLVPKAGNNQTRLIFHLSYDFPNGNKSLNANTPEELCSVKYRDLDYAVATCLKLMNRCPGRTPLYFAKTDAKSAFRVLPIRVDQRCWLVIMAVDPKTGIKKFFVDKCLPFGTSISCAQFQKFSDALQFLAEYRIQVTFCITNYLDDFLFVAWLKCECDRMMREFLKLCKLIRCPIAMDKTEWGTTVIVFLGVLMDGENLCIAIPKDKKVRAHNQLMTICEKRKVKVHYLQLMLGLLNFLSKTIVPGRVFTRWLYSKIPQKLYKLQQHRKLKPHHHVNTDHKLREDCKVWLTFIREVDSNRSLLCRPFSDWDSLKAATDIPFWSDSSANENLGFGVVYQNNWTYGSWEPGFVKREKPSIEYLELFAVCVGFMTWGHKIRNVRVNIFCDNMSVVHMINNSSSNCCNCMYLLRLLVTNNIINNRRVFAKHIRTESNTLADALSRLDLKRFWKHAPKDMHAYPDEVPSTIWPVSRIWQQN